MRGLGVRKTTPYYIHLKNKQLFAFAGIYEPFKQADGTEINAFAILTTEPNELVDKIHNRMPVILASEDEEDWINPDETEEDRLTPLLKPYPASEMTTRQVSSAVNNPRNNNLELLKPFK